MTITHHPELFVDTPLGRLLVWSTGPHHVGIRTAHNDRDEAAAAGVARSVTINRVEYTFRADLFPADYAKAHEAEHHGYNWRPRAELGGWVCPQGTGVYLSRVDWTGPHGFEPSPAAKQKAAVHALGIVVDLLNTPAGRKLLADSDAKVRADELAAAKQAVDDARSRLAEAERRLTAAYDAVAGNPEAVTA